MDVSFIAAIRRFRVAMKTEDGRAIARTCDDLRFTHGQRRADLLAMVEPLGIDAFRFEELMIFADASESP